MRNKSKFKIEYSCVFDILFSGLKFQSNLNEIDKFEQKSQADSASKAYEWPTQDGTHANSKYKSKHKKTSTQ